VFGTGQVIEVEFISDAGDPRKIIGACIALPCARHPG
jgi:hypothetical protein